TLPVFDQGQAGTSRASSELRRSFQNYAALAVEIRAAIRAAYSRLVSARARVDFYRSSVLPLQKRILGESELEYNAMQIGIGSLLEARSEQVEAEIQLVDATRDYWVAHAQLERAIGGDLPSEGQRSVAAADAPSHGDGERK